MSFENIDAYTVMLAEAYAKDEYYKGYVKGKKKGIGIGSYRTYNYFIKEGHWEDVTPYIEGYWIKDMDTYDNVIYICSVCEGHIHDNVEGYEYCPLCGTRMVGGINEHN